MEDLIFLDEFGINLAMTRTHARAPLGERVKVTEPFHHGSNISVISALGLQGVCAPMTSEGAVNSEVFELYVKHLLVPCLRHRCPHCRRAGEEQYTPGSRPPV
jgi:hypothetical protein